MERLIVILLIVIILILAPGLLLVLLGIGAIALAGIQAIIVPVITSLAVGLLLVVLIAIFFEKPSVAKPKGRVANTAQRPKPSPGPQYAGPGKYRIRGVDRESQMDTVWYCSAESRDNAKVKAGLEGIIVTQIEPVERADALHKPI